MKEYLGVLKKSLLFQGIGDDDILSLLSEYKARAAQFTHDEYILREGEGVFEIGIVLKGKARSVKEDASGRVFLLTELGEGSFIGVLLAASRARKSPVSVQAQGDLTALFIPFDHVFRYSGKMETRHAAFLRNCFDSLAEKALMLHDRIECLLRTSVREKIFAYLSQTSTDAGSKCFSIPFDRNAFAAYINVERSALSRELSKMKKDGLIDYHKNTFTLL